MRGTLLLSTVLLLAVACGGAADLDATVPTPTPTPTPTVLDEGIAIIDYRATPENQAVVARVLSDAGIRFRIESLPSGGWGPRVERLAITVAHADVARADALLRAAADDGRLDVVPGTADLVSRF